MTIVKQLLQNKGFDVWTIAPDASVYEALQLMAAKNVGALVVLEAGKLMGIISERDYARKVILLEKSSMTVLVKETMTKQVYCVGPENTIEECMGLMTEQRVRHLPVLVNDKLVGIVSIGDVVKAIISDREFIIEQLENYIVSGG
jgi:CBS domain-containing protein